MAILRMREIREMTPDERRRKLEELRTELSRLKAMVRAGGSIENPGRIRELRRTIARILTVMREEGERP
ncbi:50S ribosomal protein L29 [Candidatus Bathyarchaeota archaeon]|nr:MAG: 50S ribosomal protein L29 [Candidatus Bathyarchaeota archaeon]